MFQWLSMVVHRQGHLREPRGRPEMALAWLVALIVYHGWPSFQEKFFLDRVKKIIYVVV